MLCLYTLEFYSDKLKFDRKVIDLKGIMLDGVNQTQKDKINMLSFLCGLHPIMCVCVCVSAHTYV